MVNQDRLMNHDQHGICVPSFLIQHYHIHDHVKNRTMPENVITAAHPVCAGDIADTKAHKQSLRAQQVVFAQTRAPAVAQVVDQSDVLLPVPYSSSAACMRHNRKAAKDINAAATLLPILPQLHSRRPH